VQGLGLGSQIDLASLLFPKLCMSLSRAEAETAASVLVKVRTLPLNWYNQTDLNTWVHSSLVFELT